MSPLHESGAFVRFLAAIVGEGILALAIGPSVWAATLVANGSFESGSFTFGGDGGADLAPSSTAISGWTIFTNHIAPLRTGNAYGIVAEEGDVSLDLQGYSDSSPFGGLQQTINTVAGEGYELSFWVGVDNDSSIAVGPATVTAIAGSASQQFTNTLTGQGNQWEQFQLDFTAAGSSTVISLVGTSTAGGAYIGLDNVVVVAVPLLRGDFNRDGHVTMADIPAMLMALTDLSVYQATYLLDGSQLAAIGDFDNSGVVTNRDIQGLLDLVASLGGGSVAAVPEPTSLLLLTAGGLLLILGRAWVLAGCITEPKGGIWGILPYEKV